MSEPRQKVASLAQRRARRKRGNGSGGDDWDDRLRAVEEAIVAIETELPHLAKREGIQEVKQDIQALSGNIEGLKTWALQQIILVVCGIGGLVVAALKLLS